MKVSILNKKLYVCRLDWLIHLQELLKILPQMLSILFSLPSFFLKNASHYLDRFENWYVALHSPRLDLFSPKDKGR